MLNEDSLHFDKRTMSARLPFLIYLVVLALGLSNSYVNARCSFSIEYLLPLGAGFVSINQIVRILRMPTPDDKHPNISKLTTYLNETGKWRFVGQISSLVGIPCPHRLEQHSIEVTGLVWGFVFKDTPCTIRLTFDPSFDGALFQYSMWGVFWSPRCNVVRL